MRLPFASLPFLLSGVLAQIPTDSALVLETTNPTVAPSWFLVGPSGGGYSYVNFGWTTLRPVCVAVDPVDPRFYYFHSNNTLAPSVGTHRVHVDPILFVQQVQAGLWQQGSGQRLACGPADVFALQGNAVTRCARTGGGGATTVFTAPNAVDLAAGGTRVWAATNLNGAPAPVWEHDLATNTQRVVGNYGGVRSIAASPSLTELALGFDNGQLARVDVTTGAITSVLPGFGTPVVAVDYTTSGTLMWADAVHVHSETAAAPVYTAIVGIADLSVARAVTASATPFGFGCGLNGNVSWLVNSLPVLGNSSFRVILVAQLAAPYVLMAVGTNRTVWTGPNVGLPFDLGPYGAPGCEVLVDPQSVLTLVPLPQQYPAVMLAIPIPSNPAFAGVSFYLQGFVPQTTTALGFETTAGLACVIQ